MNRITNNTNENVLPTDFHLNGHNLEFHSRHSKITTVRRTSEEYQHQLLSGFIMDSQLRTLFTDDKSFHFSADTQEFYPQKFEPSDTNNLGNNMN